MIEVREYVDAAGKSPFTKWLRDLNVQAAVKVAVALERIADGNLSNFAQASSNSGSTSAPATLSISARTANG